MSPLIIMLLASVGPFMVGFVGMKDDSDEDAPEEDGQIPEDPSDRVAMVDVANFIENARTQTDDPAEMSARSGTDAVFNAEPNVSTAHDASGGNDIVTRPTLENTLVGGDGADTIAGESGDDALFLGTDDTGRGGEGSDVFATLRDATGAIVITDFNRAEDALVVETDDPDNTAVADQTVYDDGLLVRLSNGLNIRLEGVSEPLPEDAVQFVQTSAPGAQETDA